DVAEQRLLRLVVLGREELEGDRRPRPAVHLWDQHAGTPAVRGWWATVRQLCNNRQGLPRGVEMRRRVRGFLARRLSSEEYLGLHLTVGLLLCLLLLGAFSLVAHSVAGQQGLTAFDDHLGRDLATHRVESPVIRDVFVVFTYLGSIVCITALSVLVGL